MSDSVGPAFSQTAVLDIDADWYCTVLDLFRREIDAREPPSSTPPTSSMT